MTDWGGLTDEDPLGAASARLLAAGLPLGDRRQALRVLGALLDDAGRRGRLPANPMTFLGLVSRLGMPLEDVLRYRKWLEAVGALSRDGQGWLVAGADHYLPSAVSSVDALDCIAAVLGESGPDLATVTTLHRPAPTAVARLTQARGGVTRAGGGRSRRRLPRSSVTFAGFGVAAAILWVLALVQPAPQRVQGVSSEGAIEAPPAPAVPAPSDPRAVRGADSRPQAPAATADSPDTAVATAASRAAACPTGAPLVLIRSLDGPQVEGIGSAMLDEVPSVVVAGVATNPTEAPVTVGSFSVVLDTGGERLTIDALSDPISLDAGASMPWRAVVPVPSQPVTTIVAEVEGLSWTWADDALAATCRN